jgi:poly(A) polymerase
MKINLEFYITDELQNLLNVLNNNGAMPRFVGGMVRDSIIGIKNADIDIAQMLLPDEVMNILSQNKIRSIDTGGKYGTITALIGDDKAEITTLRIDTECDGRHTKPIFTDDFEQDAVRRDFTINSMSYCPYKQELYDYTSGYEDLIAKKVRFIGDPKERIEEDHLRILRFFRFSDRFAKDLDKKSLNSCINLRHLLQKISKERILLELNKMIMSETAHNVFKQMFDAKIFEIIMPEAIFDLPFLVEVPLDSTLRYAALLHKTPIDIAQRILQSLKFSNSNTQQIINLIIFKQKNKDLSLVSLQELKNIFYPLWVDNLIIEPYLAISEVRQNTNYDKLNNILNLDPPKFPINGGDLIALNITGKEIGNILPKLKKQWIESEFSISKENLLQQVKAT